MMGIAGIAHYLGEAQLPLMGSIILLAGLLALSAIDLETGLLPNWLTLPLIGVGLVQNWAIGHAMWPFVLGGLTGYLLIFLLSAHWMRARGERGIGLGDAKMLAASGTWVGVFALPGVLLIASGAGLVLVIASAWVKNTSVGARMAIPFGPFLALGTWTVWCNTNLLV